MTLLMGTFSCPSFFLSLSLAVWGHPKDEWPVKLNRCKVNLNLSEWKEASKWANQWNQFRGISFPSTSLEKKTCWAQQGSAAWTQLETKLGMDTASETDKAHLGNWKQRRNWMLSYLTWWIEDLLGAKSGDYGKTNHNNFCVFIYVSFQ